MGWLAWARSREVPVEFPLCEIEGIEDKANRKLIEDYSYWLANYG